METTLSRIPTLTASIRQAFADTERDLPSEDTLAHTAAFIAAHVDMDACAELVKFPSDKPADVRACFREYREALGEVGSPGRIAQRHMLRASALRDDAAYHLAIAADYEASAARYAANGNTVIAEQHATSARAGRESTAEALAEAERLEARAKEMVTPAPTAERAAKGIARHMFASALAAASSHAGSI